jgi:hypothetical protein
MIISSGMNWAARMGEVRNACKVLVGKPLGPLVLIRRHRRKVNIELNLEEFG